MALGRPVFRRLKPAVACFSFNTTKCLMREARHITMKTLWILAFFVSRPSRLPFDLVLAPQNIDFLEPCVYVSGRRVGWQLWNKDSLRRLYPVRIVW